MNYAMKNLKIIPESEAVMPITKREIFSSFGVYESIKAGVGSAVDACYTSATGGVLDGAIDLISVNPDHLNYMITAFLYMGIVSSCCLHTALKNYNCVNDPVDKS